MKNCLVIVRNKKLNRYFKKADEVSGWFSSFGFYFDKVVFVPFDSSSEICTQLEECRNNYDNAVILCEDAQIKTISNFFKKYGDGYSFYVLSCNKVDFEQCEQIVEEWNERYNVSYGKFHIKAVGAPSSRIEGAIEQANLISKDLSFSIHDNYGDQSIEITYSNLLPKITADKVLRVFVTHLDGYIYALEDISLAERLFQILKLRRMKISVAESFTGGGISARLVEVSGISQVYYEGLNTYSNNSKRDRLGVKEITLNRLGAVSDETASQMVEGLLASGNCDVAISTTGIAGPKSDNSDKPVGLAYIAVGTKDKIAVYKFNFKGDRKNITETAINRALFLTYKTLK